MSHPQQGDLPSAVFFGFPCISLTTHSHKPPIAEWDVSKIISDVSYIAIVKRSHRICLQSFSLPKTGWLWQLKTWKSQALREMSTMADQKVEPVLIPVAILDVGRSRDAAGLIEVEKKTTRSCHSVSDSPHPKWLSSPFNLFFPPTKVVCRKKKKKKITKRLAGWLNKPSFFPVQVDQYSFHLTWIAISCRSLPNFLR